MASTLVAAKAGSTVQPKAGIGVSAVCAVYEIAAALVVNDVIQMCKVPKGATILDIILATDDLDSGGTGALVLDVGDGGAAERFMKDIDAKAPGVHRINVVDALGYVYTAEDTIDVKVSTAPETGATSGTIRLTVLYTMNP